MSDHYQVFSEIEWEHGPNTEDGHGTVALERAWLEYLRSDALKVRVGKFLVPFGLWNVVHDATPTFLSVFLPGAVYGRNEGPVGRQRMYPKFGNGIWLTGSILARPGRVEYHAYVTNGRGDAPFERDDNANKGAGGRIVVSPAGWASLGASFYSDRNGDRGHTRQTSIGADATLRLGRLSAWVEVILPRNETLGADDRPTGVFQTGLGAYAWLAYDVGRGLTPYVILERYDPDRDATGGERDTWVGGLNLSVTPRVYLKGEVQTVRFEDAPAVEDYTHFAGQLAVAF
jgi:hypothetical protein